MLFFIHREKGDCVHNSLAIVENIVELGPGVFRGAFYNIICPFYAFLYTQRGGRRCARQPGHCGEHCLLRPGVCLEAFYNIMSFLCFSFYTEKRETVCISVAIVENIGELGPGVCLEAFYNIICPFYAFLYTRREGRWCAQQPGHCREHCGVPGQPAVCWEERKEMVCTTAWQLWRTLWSSGEACAGRLFKILFVLFTLSFVHREEGDGVHNSLAIVENIVEFWRGMCREAF
jgi:hypothetical protein